MRRLTSTCHIVSIMQLISQKRPFRMLLLERENEEMPAKCLKEGHRDRLQ